MDPFDSTRIAGMLRRVLRDCRKLYRDSGKWMVRRYPTLIQGQTQDFVQLMDDLHRGLLIKVYVTIVRADERWSVAEKRIAGVMIEYLWNEKLDSSQLRDAAMQLFEQADRLSWESLVAPYVRYEPLANAKAQVETVVLRMANLVAKCDGQTMPEEAVALHSLQQQIDMALNPAKPESVLAPLKLTSQGPQATQSQHAQQHAGPPPAPQAMSDQQRQQRLTAAMEELDSLIGLKEVKQRVRSYANFLRLQRQRREKGLSTMPISLHMAFVGNPGTGKTTVARIVGQILGAMGTLPSGHVVETDRSGLVAEYAGQTAGKTNKLCDSALGGVLFIDEAYSLVDASGDDAYGREAIQTLLKRMEDNREQMAVILAGYSNEMEELIKSNPGLTSRINTTIDFEDYTAAELGSIFECLCEANQYELPAAARHRLLVAFDQLYQERDRHFGNGRLVRNAFEDTVRRLADRIADVTTLSEALLTSLSEADIAIPGLNDRQLTALMQQPHRLRFTCSGCRRKIIVAPESLGRGVRCGACKKKQTAPWAEIEWLSTEGS
ncbi:MAG: AAA family ATPase [Planctomycetota bacterium]